MTNDWSSPVPQAALHAALKASEAASGGDRAGCCAILSASAAPPHWLAVAALRFLADLLTDRAALVTQLRDDIHAVAVENGADDLIVCANLEVIAIAAALAAGDSELVNELTGHTQFLPSDWAAIASQISGQIISSWAGEHAAEVFAGIRANHGIEGL